MSLPSPSRRLRRLLGALLVTCLGACDAAPQKPVRVVLITLDTLRADRLGEGPLPLARLAALARERGVTFDNAWAATSSTQPTHASLLTGLHPWQHGVTRNGMILPEAHPTVAEQLSADGFATGAVVASFPMSGQFGWRRGFDTYIEDFSQGRPEKKTFDGFEVDWDGFYAQADSVTDPALELLDGLAGPRQFLFVHYYDPHSPYGDSFRPEPGDERTLADVQLETRDLTLLTKRDRAKLPATLRKAERGYDRDVAFLDEQLARLLERLLADGASIETHVVITADHGESFGDDESFGHGDRVSPPQLHVPLVMFSPRLAAGGRRDDPVGSVDIAATLLSLAGHPGAAGGRDLTRPVPARVPPPMGMRRSYAEPAWDVRISGEKHELWGDRFWVLRDGRIVYGNGQQLDAYGAPVGEREARELRKLFELFSYQLTESGSDENLDPDVQAILESLGYTR